MKHAPAKERRLRFSDRLRVDIVVDESHGEMLMDECAVKRSLNITSYAAGAHARSDFVASRSPWICEMPEWAWK